MTPKTLLLAAATSATPALADRPLTIEQFEAFVTGRTFTYASNGNIYGIEAYGPNRQVIWAIYGNECKEGTYYQGPNDSICFVYPVNGGDNNDCFIFTKDGLGLDATDTDNTPYDVDPTTDTVPCIGPLLGV